MKFYKKFSVKNYWLITYLVIFLLPIIMLTTILFSMENMALELTNNYSKSVLTQTQNKVDTEMKNIHQFILNLSSFKELHEVMAMEELSEYDRMVYYGIEDGIYSSAANYGISGEMYIYLKKSGVVISESGIINSHSAYLKYASDYNLSYDEWQSRLIEGRNFHFWKLNDKKNPDGERLCLTYALKNRSFTDENATVVIYVNSNQIDDLINQNLYNGTVFLLSTKKEVEFAFGNRMEYDNLDFDTLVHSEATDKIRINGETYQVLFGQSAVGGYSYLVMAPMADMYRQMNFLKFLLIILVLIVIAVGVILIIRMVKQNYRPIEELFSDLNYTLLKRDGKKQLTYESIDDIRKNLHTYSKNYHYGQKALQAAKINKLLNFEISSFNNNDFNGLFGEYEKGNVVVLFGLEKYANFFEEESESEQIDVVHFMINNVLSEMFCDIESLTTGIGKTLVLVLATDYDNHDDFHSSLLKKLEYIIGFFSDNFDIDLIAAIGSYEKHPKDIRKSYNHALETMVYKNIFPKPILCYSEIAQRENKYYFSKEEANILSSYIKCGNSERAIKLIDDILEDNISVKKISYKYIRMLFFEIALTVQAGFETLDEGGDLRNKELFKLLQNYENYEKIKEDIMLLVENACDAGNDTGTNDIFRKITEYIEENYDNVLLSNDDIAGYCGLSKSYLSTVFKKKNNENLVTYITKFRVEKAKPLLLTNLNLAEIAEKCGFVNSNTFIRAFKKYEGVTPGNWRKNIRK